MDENESKDFIDLLKVSSMNPFLPVIDKNGKVVKVVVISKDQKLPLYP